MAADKPVQQQIYDDIETDNDGLEAAKLLRAVGDKCQQEKTLEWVAKQSTDFLLTAELGKTEAHDDVLHYAPTRRYELPVLHIEAVPDSCNSK